MQAESLQVLENADVASVQARAIVRAIEIEIAGAKDTLATKNDLLFLRQDLRSEIAEVRSEIAELRTELRGEIAALRTEIKGDMLKLEAKLVGAIHEMGGGITRQMYLAVMGQMGLLLGFAYFFSTHMR